MLWAIIRIILLLAVLPTPPYSSAWGHYPSGGIGVILITLLVLLLIGYMTASQHAAVHMVCKLREW